MSPLLQRIFRIEPGEGRKVAQFAALGLLLQAGLALGTAGADSIFLVNAGADKLPHIYLLTPLVMVFYIPAYSYLLGRLGVARVFDLTLGVLVAGGAALWLAFRFTGDATPPLALCYIAKLYAALWCVGIYTLFWNFIDRYFDLVDAKRFFALFAAGSAMGAIIGGSMVSPLTARFGVEPLFLGWALSAAATWPLAVWTRRTTHELDAGDGEQSGPFGPKEAIQTAGRLLDSRYATILTALLFVTLVTATLCEYQYMSVFAEGLDEATLAGLLGRLTAIVNVLNLALTLFVFNRLVTRIGVRNVALIQPVTYALVFTWLLLDRGFLSAAAGFVAYQGIMTAIEYNNVNLLFSGLPASIRGQLRTMIEGIGEPLATASAGVFLFFAGSRLSPAQVSIWGILSAAVCLGFVFALRSDYAAAIAANLRRDWLDFSRRTDPVLRNAGDEDIALAAHRATSPDAAEAILAVRFLRLNEPSQAASALMTMLKSSSSAHREAARPLLDEFLSDPGSTIAQEIHRWLDQHPDVADSELASDLGHHRLLPFHQARVLVAGDQPRTRAAGAVMLWSSWHISDNADALEHIRSLLASDQVNEIIVGLDAASRLGETKYAYLLRDFLKHPSAAVRSAALAAISGLASGADSALLPDLLAMVEQGLPDERAQAFDAIERIGDSSVLEPILEHVQGYTPGDRRRIERLILSFGPRTVPLLTTIAQSSHFPVAARCVALRAIGKLSFPQVDALARPLIASTLNRAYRFLGSYLALTREPKNEAGHAVLTRIHHDFPALAIEIVLETLTIAGRLPGYEAPLAALQGGQSKERGYAIETIEQACDRSLFTLLLPLIDGRSLEAQVEFGLEHGLLPALTAEDVLTHSLASGFPLEASAAIQALHATGRAEGGDRLVDKLCQLPHPLLRATVLTLLARESGDGTELTPVEIVRELMGIPALEHALFVHHEALASLVRVLEPAEGDVLFTAGELADGLWQVMTGGIRLTDTDALLGPGTTAGVDDFYGAGRCSHTGTALRGTRLLHVPLAAIEHCVHLHPSLGLVLLRHKLGA